MEFRKRFNMNSDDLLRIMIEERCINIVYDCKHVQGMHKCLEL